MKKIALLILTVSLTSCGSNSNDGNGLRDSDAIRSLEGERGQGAQGLTEIEATHPESIPSLVSTFAVSEGREAAMLAFYTGDRYFGGVIRQISGRTYQAQGVLGYYTRGINGVKFRARRTTCRQYLPTKAKGTVGFPEDNRITISNNSVTAVMERISSNSPGASQLVIQWGCFSQSGVFTPQPWSDI